MLRSVYIFNGTSSLTQQLKHLADFLYVYRTKKHAPRDSKPVSANFKYTQRESPRLYVLFLHVFPHKQEFETKRWQRYHSRRCIKLHTIYEEKKRVDAGAQTRWSVTVYLYFVIYNTSYLLFVICYLQYKSCDGPLQICTQAFFNTVPIRNIWQIFQALYQTRQPQKKLADFLHFPSRVLWEITCFGGFSILANTQTVYAIKWKYLADFSQVPPPPLS